MKRLFYRVKCAFSSFWQVFTKESFMFISLEDSKEQSNAGLVSTIGHSSKMHTTVMLMCAIDQEVSKGNVLIETMLWDKFGDHDDDFDATDLNTIQ